MCLEPTRCWQSLWGIWGRVFFTRLLEIKVTYFILVKYTRLYMRKAHAESFVQPAEESCNNVSYLQRQKLPAKIGEKLDAYSIQSCVLKSSLCSWYRPIEVQRQSCHRCAQKCRVLPWHIKVQHGIGTAKCSDQQSMA